jgi:hypothetical protein
MSYKLSDILRIAENPALIRGEIRKFGQHFNHWFHQKFSDCTGVDVFEEDWDTLIILDGCRYDTFAELNDISGELESRQSQGSTSWEFMEANFHGRELYDTVYITANPHIYRLDEGIFHDIVDLLDQWDETTQTIPPAEVVAAAREVTEQYPEKRYIFHFMQPHYPFLGETGQTLDHRGHEKDVDSPHLDQPNVWDVLQWGKNPTVTEQKVWKAYRENLELVLEDVEELLNIVSGRTVITADHGNLIGDRLSPIPVRGYGHPGGLRAPELVTVPWHIIDTEPRREITAERPSEPQHRDEDDVVDQLAALGYTE